MMSLRMDIQLPKGKDKCEGVAVAAPMVKDNDGCSAPKIFHDMVYNSTGPKATFSNSALWTRDRSKTTVTGCLS